MSRKKKVPTEQEIYTRKMELEMEKEARNIEDDIENNELGLLPDDPDIEDFCGE